MSEEPKKKPANGKFTKENPGPGRPPGVPNKNTMALKEMILKALDDAGGPAYLARQADENPAAFMTLIGKVLPMAVNLGDANGEKFSVNVTFPGKP